jgi:hypothetical protein
MRRPQSAMEPAVTFSKPAIMRSVEVLPQPDDPRSAMISPLLTSISSARTA